MINLNKNTDGTTDDFFRGDNLQFKFNVLQGGNKMTDLDSYTWKMSIRNGRDVIATNDDYLSVSSDTVSVNIPPEVTQNFITGNERIMIEIEMSKSNWKKTIFRGSLKVTEDIVK